jgi:hypothetical protein
MEDILYLSLVKFKEFLVMKTHIRKEMDRELMEKELYLVAEELGLIHILMLKLI